MKDWIFAIFWACVLSFSLIFLGGCPKKKDPSYGERLTKAAQKICRQHCPKNTTFSFRVEFRQDWGEKGYWACYCYPQFGAPVIKRFSRELIGAEAKRKEATPMKPQVETNDW